MKRKVNEAIHTKQRAPSINRDQDYQLPSIYSQIIPRPPSESDHPPSLRDTRSAEGKSKRRNRFTQLNYKYVTFHNITVFILLFMLQEYKYGTFKKKCEDIAILFEVLSKLSMPETLSSSISSQILTGICRKQ